MLDRSGLKWAFVDKAKPN